MVWILNVLPKARVLRVWSLADGTLERWWNLREVRLSGGKFG
jgi:hypothetical protein